MTEGPQSVSPILRGGAGFEAIQRSIDLLTVDLAGFTALTSRWIADDRRKGAERVSDLVTSVFAELTDRLKESGVQVGGFGGDALALWAPAGEMLVPPAAFDQAVSDALSKVSEPMSFRCAHATGHACVGHAFDGVRRIPVIWGGAIAKAFEAMARANPLVCPSNEDQTPSGPPPLRASSEKLAAASVTARWTLVTRLADPVQSIGLGPDEVAAAWRACGAAAASVGAVCENLSQDDKGLILMMGFPAGPKSHVSAVEAVTEDLRASLPALGFDVQFAAAHGEVFRTPALFGADSVPIALGASINRAAKDLAAGKGGAPSAESRPVADQPAPDEPLPASRSSLFGRHDSLADLRAAISDDRQPGANVVDLVGPSGIGKTTVLCAALEQSQTPFIEIALRPRHLYAPFAAIKVLSGELNLAPPADNDWVGAVEHIGQLLPCTVVVDDWHWCDSASADVIMAAVRSAPSTTLIRVRRPGTAEDLPTVRADHTITLGPVNAETAEAIITRALGRPPTSQETYLITHLSRSVPFWIGEVARDLAKSEADGIKPSARSLPALLGARYGSLGERAQSAWRLLCAWQTPIDLATANAILAPFDVSVDRSDFKEIEALGWCVSEGTGDYHTWRPAHQLLADWGATELPASIEERLHTRMARHLAQFGDVADETDHARIADHWLKAGQSLRAAISFERAAVAAGSVGAHRLCLDLMDKSDALGAGKTGVSTRRRRYRLAHRAAAEWGTGGVRPALIQLQRMDRAVEKTGRLVSDRARQAAVKAEFVRAEAAHFGGKTSMVMKGLRRGVALSRPASIDLEAYTRRSALTNLMLCLMRVPVRGRMRTLIAEAQTAGDARSETLLQVYYGVMHFCRSDWRGARPPIERARQVVADTRDPLLVGIVIALDAAHALLTGDGPACAARYRELSDLGSRSGQRMYQSWGAYGEAEAQLMMGAFQSAYHLAQSATELRKGIGDHQSACIVEGVLAQAAMGMGDRDRALFHARRAQRWAERLPMVNFTSLEGIAAAAQVAAEASLAPDGATDAVTGLYKRGRKSLARYALVFPFARPRLLTVEGMFDIHRRPNRAAKRLMDGLLLAEKRQMGREQMLANRGLELRLEHVS